MGRVATPVTPLQSHGGPRGSYLMKLKTEQRISHQSGKMTPLNFSPAWHKEGEDEGYFQARKGNG